MSQTRIPPGVGRSKADDKLMTQRCSQIPKEKRQGIRAQFNISPERGSQKLKAHNVSSQASSGETDGHGTVKADQ